MKPDLQSVFLHVSDADLEVIVQLMLLIAK